jgi:hypothetical protein
MNNNSLPPGIVNHVITNINNLSNYAKTLSEYCYITQNQQECFLDSAVSLENVKKRWQSGEGKCLSKSDIIALINFGDLLTSNSINRYFVSNSIHKRLMKFWSSIQHLPNNKVVEVVIGQHNVTVSLPSLGFDKIYAARENTNMMIDTVVKRNYNNDNSLLILDIPTILLTIMIRSEAHEYTLGNILKRTKEITKDLIDIPELLSVVRKVPKGQDFKSDTRAIRDATAHAKFKIDSDSMGDFIIHFNNTDEHYSFQATFSRKELLHYYQDYDRMTSFYTQLLSITLLYSFLNMNFVYD